MFFKRRLIRPIAPSFTLFVGRGSTKTLKVLQEVKHSFGVPVLTDVHEIPQAAPVAEVCDILQVPAFFARQTDLIAAIAATDAVINVKKPQFMSLPQIQSLVGKFVNVAMRKFCSASEGRALAMTI
jgi:2-dehydro-3-deoxyphosphooctonate aldolase (KDO 8-P synthase)